MLEYLINLALDGNWRNLKPTTETSDPWFQIRADRAVALLRKNDPRPNSLFKVQYLTLAYQNTAVDIYAYVRECPTGENDCFIEAGLISTKSQMTIPLWRACWKQRQPMVHMSQDWSLFFLEEDLFLPYRFEWRFFRMSSTELFRIMETRLRHTPPSTLEVQRIPELLGKFQNTIGQLVAKYRFQYDFMIPLFRQFSGINP